MADPSRVRGYAIGFRKAILRNLKGADLRGIDFHITALESVVLQGVFYNQEIQRHDGFHYKEFGVF